jgi:hypothetical protein
MIRSAASISSAVCISARATFGSDAPAARLRHCSARLLKVSITLTIGAIVPLTAASSKPMSGTVHFVRHGGASRFPHECLLKNWTELQLSKAPNALRERRCGGSASNSPRRSLPVFRRPVQELAAVRGASGASSSQSRRNPTASSPKWPAQALSKRGSEFQPDGLRPRCCSTRL